MNEIKFQFLSKKLEDLDNYTKLFLDYVQNKEPIIKQQIISSYFSISGISKDEIDQNTQGRLMIERFYFTEYLFNMYGHYFDDVSYNKIKQEREKFNNQWQEFSSSKTNKQLTEDEKKDLLTIINSMNESNIEINEDINKMKRAIVKEIEVFEKDAICV